MKAAQKGKQRKKRMLQLFDGIPLMKTLDDKARKAVAKGVHLLSLEDGESLLSEVKDAKSLFVIIKGSLLAVDRAFDPDEEPDGHDFTYLHADEMAGPSPLLENLVASGPALVVQFDKKMFRKQLRDKPFLVHQLIRALSTSVPMVLEGHVDRDVIDPNQGPELDDDPWD